MAGFSNTDKPSFFAYTVWKERILEKQSIRILFEPAVILKKNWRVLIQTSIYILNSLFLEIIFERKSSPTANTGLSIFFLICLCGLIPALVG